ncbi:head maturation protease, ClpP-related [Piscirickettsia litoralis]|nr:head maturation protease, ClpP-related [Piscirickettsia litoralis]
MSTNFNFLAKSNKQTDVMLYGNIGSGNAKDFIQKIKSIPKDHKVNLMINSRGGDVMEGSAMVDCIKELGDRCVATVEVVAASMASLLAVSASKTKMAKNAYLMIHHPYTTKQGNAKHFKSLSETLGSLSKSMINGYCEKTGLPEEKVDEMLDRETWIDAKAAIDLGFADEIIEGSNIQASINPDEFGYKNVPQSLLNPPKQEETKPMGKFAEFKALLEELKDDEETKAFLASMQQPDIKPKTEEKLDDVSSFKALIENQSAMIKQLQDRENERRLATFEAKAKEFSACGQEIDAKTLMNLHDNHPDTYANTVQALELASNVYKAEQKGLFQAQGYSGEAKLSGKKGEFQAKVKESIGSGVSEDEAIIASMNDNLYTELD